MREQEDTLGHIVRICVPAPRLGTHVRVRERPEGSAWLHPEPGPIDNSGSVQEIGLRSVERAEWNQGVIADMAGASAGRVWSVFTDPVEVVYAAHPRKHPAQCCNF